MIINRILSILSAAITLYTIFCFIDIIMSWIPGLKFTKFGRFISSICDPYLGLFSRMSFMHIGNIDFSPIISIGLLTLLSSILSGINRTGRIYFGGIIATIIGMVWSICNTLLSILFLLTLIRWIALIANHGQTSFDSGWNNVDVILNKFTYKVAATFTRRPVNYQTTLLVTWIVFLAALILGNILFNGLLIPLCYRIAF